MTYLYVIKRDDWIFGIVDEEGKKEFEDLENDVRNLEIEEVPYYKGKEGAVELSLNLWEGYENSLCG